MGAAGAPVYDVATMPDPTFTDDAAGQTITPADETPEVDPVARARELAIVDALRSVVDPEIGMNVVELALIRQVVLGDEETEVKMVLTTPFCPYAGSLIQQIKEAAEQAEGHPVKVTLLAERWDPRDAGLVW
jgi:metal-sulfur cluster biosynthetic enzyme